MILSRSGESRDFPKTACRTLLLLREVDEKLGDIFSLQRDNLGTERLASFKLFCNFR